MSFKTSSLASLSSLITKGTTPTTLGYAHSDSGIPFLRVQNIFSGQVNFKEDTLFIDSNTHTALKRSQIQGGDVLVTIAGTIGRTGVVPHDAPEMNCNQAVAIVRPTPEIERSYLRHWLESQDAHSQMLGSTVTGTISNLSLSQLGELRVPLPSLEEQRRIAAILDQAETLRTQRRTALALLDSLTQSLFLDMFGDPVANPKEFEIKPLADVTKFENGDRSSNYPSGDDLKTSGVLFLSTKNIVNNTLDLSQPQYITEEKFSSLSRGKALSGDLIITLRGTLGSCCIFDGGHKTAFINAQMMLIRPTVKVLSVYLHALLTSDNAKAHFDYIGRGAAVPQLTSAQLAELKVLVPPLPLQQTFATRIASIEALQATHRRALAALDALFASLQQRAFAGQL